MELGTIEMAVFKIDLRTLWTIISVILLLVVDEYGEVEGVLTMEDVLETILGLEIVDEGDKSRDMQELARRFWQRRAKQRGAELQEAVESGDEAN